MIHAFLAGLLLAFGLIIPLGIQNIFVFNQGALQRPYFRALPSVVMASVCDTLLILIAVLGISATVFAIPILKNIILIAGFFFLSYMGFLTWKNNPPQSSSGESFTIKKQIIFATSVSLLNPHALIDTIGVIGTSSLQFVSTERWIFTLACILVSWIWFLSLSLLGYCIQQTGNNVYLIRAINKMSAIIIWAVAINIAYHLYKSNAPLTYMVSALTI